MLSFFNRLRRSNTNVPISHISTSLKCHLCGQACVSAGGCGLTRPSCCSINVFVCNECYSSGLNATSVDVLKIFHKLNGHCNLHIDIAEVDYVKRL
jgi:hypothetical protein